MRMNSNSQGIRRSQVSLHLPLHLALKGKISLGGGHGGPHYGVCCVLPGDLPAGGRAVAFARWRAKRRSTAGAFAAAPPSQIQIHDEFNGGVRQLSIYLSTPNSPAFNPDSLALHCANQIVPHRTRAIVPHRASQTRIAGERGASWGRTRDPGVGKSGAGKRRRRRRSKRRISRCAVSELVPTPKIELEAAKGDAVGGVGVQQSGGRSGGPRGGYTGCAGSCDFDGEENGLEPIAVKQFRRRGRCGERCGGRCSGSCGEIRRWRWWVLWCHDAGTMILEFRAPTGIRSPRQVVEIATAQM